MDLSFFVHNNVLKKFMEPEKCSKRTKTEVFNLNQNESYTLKNRYKGSQKKSLSIYQATVQWVAILQF